MRHAGDEGRRAGDRGGEARRADDPGRRALSAAVTATIECNDGRRRILGFSQPLARSRNSFVTGSAVNRGCQLISYFLIASSAGAGIKRTLTPFANLTAKRFGTCVKSLSSRRRLWRERRTA